MKTVTKICVTISIATIAAVVYAGCCGSSNDTNLTNSVSSVSNTNKVSCCNCTCCNCNKISVTETTSVKEYKIGNSILGAEIVTTTVETPAPKPETIQVWIEGYWGWALTESGYYVRRWIPGHYEKCYPLP